MRAHAVAVWLGLAGVVTSGAAHAFCGFFVSGADAQLVNNASQVVLMRKGNRTVMTMSNNYQGPPESHRIRVQTTSCDPCPVQPLSLDDMSTLGLDVLEGIGAGLDTAGAEVGGVEAVLPPAEQVPGENYVHGERVRCLVVQVHRGLRGPQITVSRTHPNLVKKLFAMEVPEIADGSVEIAAIAREAGHRTKIAVHSKVPTVRAKGACIGPMGARARAVMNELHGEKIDIVDWHADPAEFLAEALQPAKVTSVTVTDADARAARVVVPDYQLSLAIGREGQNARLAARLTGWRIDIRSDAHPEPSSG